MKDQFRSPLPPIDPPGPIKRATPAPAWVALFVAWAGLGMLIASIVFVFLPVCCVYYPVSTLPPWLQVVALALPPTYVFEGLRAVVLEGAFVGYLMVKALALNVVYFAAGWAVFAYFLQSARIHGTLVQMGE